MPKQKQREREGKPFLANVHTKEVHNLSTRTAACKTDAIKSWLEFDTLQDALNAGYDYCGFCFASRDNK